jgi:3-deoxy-7-phosphoheptulonate synthase
MILILAPNTPEDAPEYKHLMTRLANLPNIRVNVHREYGTEQVLTELYLIGNTQSLSAEDLAHFPCVERVVRVSREYRVLGRHTADERANWFDYNGVRFGQDNLNIFAGLCAVDTHEHVAAMMRAVSDAGLNCTRMGAYKPRTSPYAFQGHGAACLPYVFELAGKHSIRVIAMEVTAAQHIDEIRAALRDAGNPTGVMLQIGTRNTQNFELLKIVGQTEFPVLFKRGFGITLDESLNAAEYLASSGNRRVVFGLRGMKTNLGDPHRNFVDFSHVPVVKRLTRMPVCIDPSHSVGSLALAPDGISDLLHATAQGVIAGANMILIDFHPHPAKALVDAAQALPVETLPRFVEDVAITRRAYEQRVSLYAK